LADVEPDELLEPYEGATVYESIVNTDFSMLLTVLNEVFLPPTAAPKNPKFSSVLKN
jgi:hypothetical protein